VATTSVLQILVTTLGTAGVIGLLSRVLRTAKPNVEPDVAGEAAGAIAPEKGTAWFTVIVGCVMAVAGLYGVLFQRAGLGGVGLAVLGLCVAGVMSPSLTAVHTVSWDTEAIERPSNLFGPTLGLRRTKILWDDIARTGTTITGYRFVESRDGRRVYWSFLYKGHGVLMAHLRARRPDLKLPVAS
jgi:hypothetical protein